MELRFAAALPLALLLAACGGGSTPPPGNGSSDGGVRDGAAGHHDAPATTGDDGGGTLTDASPFDPDAFWASDPPPAWCGPDGGPTWAPPGGTPDCPDDKNRQGCPCSPAGSTAACWPGLRANRGLGICHDGTTTCVANGEFGTVWGDCVGYVLPDPAATKGAAACKCFSGGQWKVDNLSPCFVTYSGGQVYAVSTYIDGSGNAQCPTTISGTPPPSPEPGKTFSTDSLKVDCAGHYKLCYTLKAGSAATASASDCTISSVCTEADYPTENVVTTFPDLPAWTSSNTTCAAQFNSTGGYGEMSVIGLSVECDHVDDGAGNPFVFNRVQYCPSSCNTNPSGAGCQNCNQGGSGSF